MFYILMNRFIFTNEIYLSGAEDARQGGINEELHSGEKLTSLLITFCPASLNYKSQTILSCFLSPAFLIRSYYLEPCRALSFVACFFIQRKANSPIAYWLS
jgi:hypothetical protein